MSEPNRSVSGDALIGKYVDLPGLLARVENDRELLTELLAMFLEELPALRKALHDAVEIGDLPQAAKVAHTLKGMLVNMSMNRGALMAAGMETAARDRDVAAVEEALVSFDAEIAALSTAADAFIKGKQECEF